MPSSSKGSLLLAAFCLVSAYLLVPPTPYPDRLALILQNQTAIDNGQYDEQEVAQTWWKVNGTFAGLHAMNPVRLSYFDRTLRSRLGEPTPETLIVDLGCGGGLVTESLANRGWYMHGLDQSPRSVKAANRHAESTAPSQPGRGELTYTVGSIYSLPWEDGSVSGVVISDVLEHLLDLNRAFAEMNRVLKPGGVIVFDTINR